MSSETVCASFDAMRIEAKPPTAAAMKPKSKKTPAAAVKPNPKGTSPPATAAKPNPQKTPPVTAAKPNPKGAPPATAAKPNPQKTPPPAAAAKPNPKGILSSAAATPTPKKTPPAAAVTPAVLPIMDMDGEDLRFLVGRQCFGRTEERKTGPTKGRGAPKKGGKSSNHGSAKPFLVPGVGNVEDLLLRMDVLALSPAKKTAVMATGPECQKTITSMREYFDKRFKDVLAPLGRRTWHAKDWLQPPYAPRSAGSEDVFGAIFEKGVNSRISFRLLDFPLVTGVLFTFVEDGIFSRCSVNVGEASNSFQGWFKHGIVHMCQLVGVLDQLSVPQEDRILKLVQASNNKRGGDTLFFEVDSIDCLNRVQARLGSPDEIIPLGMARFYAAHDNSRGWLAFQEIPMECRQYTINRFLRDFGVQCEIDIFCDTTGPRPSFKAVVRAFFNGTEYDDASLHFCGDASLDLFIDRLCAVEQDRYNAFKAQGKWIHPYRVELFEKKLKAEGALEEKRIAAIMVPECLGDSDGYVKFVLSDFYQGGRVFTADAQAEAFDRLLGGRVYLRDEADPSIRVKPFWKPELWDQCTCYLRAKSDPVTKAISHTAEAHGISETSGETSFRCAGSFPYFLKKLRPLL